MTIFNIGQENIHINELHKCFCQFTREEKASQKENQYGLMSCVLLFRTFMYIRKQNFPFTNCYL